MLQQYQIQFLQEYRMPQMYREPLLPLQDFSVGKLLILTNQVHNLSTRMQLPYIMETYIVYQLTYQNSIIFSTSL